ncbi:aspartic proteinase 36-like isoform X2 [Macadamia integrifolia]|uniref:aspartic proteinase 36-like isoform X2 n=1 Tax=Macadamia integrifolia TaxID=60698 RepID=UPI001C4ED145|nr:aspartic proteinase 36-like isoform X2 [Macadamia integrifolia]
MDVRRWICGLSILILFEVSSVSASGVFKVYHRFSGQERSLRDVKAHDGRRHRRFLFSNIDIPLSGNSNPADVGTYYTKLAIGSPPKDYYVLVDTGSDILWVNCVECTKCPTKSSLGLELKTYDPKASATGELVTCNQEFCYLASENPVPRCNDNLSCVYGVEYQDGSSTTGYYVRDVIQYGQVSGNQKTIPSNGTVVFGCGAVQSGDIGSSDATLDGILGFGQTNTSMISQLASAGKVRRMFAHCLSGTKGGGMFAIGHVMEPKVKTTPLVPDQPHYNVNMEGVEVGGVVLQLPKDVFETGPRKGTVIDSGTTLSYLPEIIYEQLIKENDFSCFTYCQSVDDGFPTVTFHFENSLLLVVYPHDYLFQISETEWCIGWQNSGKQSYDSWDMTIFGDLVLSNKLVLYDLENQVIGWTEYNCSSSINLKDEKSGASYELSAKIPSSASGLDVGKCIIFLFLSSMLHTLIY